MTKKGVRSENRTGDLEDFNWTPRLVRALGEVPEATLYAGDDGPNSRRHLLEGWELPVHSDVENSPLQGDHYGVSSVAGIEFWQDALHVCLDRALGDVELGGDHFVRLPGGNPSQHLDLALGQRIVSHVFGDICRDLRWHPALTRVHRPNGLEQLLSDQVLEQISGSAGFQRPGCLDVAGVGREHDDAGI